MSQPDAEIVQFDNVGLRYGTDKEILADISFTLYPGCFYFLTGASGAGKTSLLKLLYLAQRPSRGLIRLFGTDAITLPRERLPGFRRRIGVVFQDFRLVSHLSAFDNVALPLRVAGVSEKDITRPVGEMLDWVGLGDRQHARPGVDGIRLKDPRRNAAPTARDADVFLRVVVPEHICARLRRVGDFLVDKAVHLNESAIYVSGPRYACFVHEHPIWGRGQLNDVCYGRQEGEGDGHK